MDTVHDIVDWTKHNILLTFLFFKFYTCSQYLEVAPYVKKCQAEIIFSRNKYISLHCQHTKQQFGILHITEWIKFFQTHYAGGSHDNIIPIFNSEKNVGKIKITLLHCLEKPADETSSSWCSCTTSALKGHYCSHFAALYVDEIQKYTYWGRNFIYKVGKVCKPVLILFNLCSQETLKPLYAWERISRPNLLKN